MRAYLAATVQHLRQLVETGTLTEPLEGFAATASLREDWGDESDEELEAALSVAAAQASAALIGGARDGLGRRVVIVAELDPVQVVPRHETPGAIAVHGGVSVGQIAAVLADPADTAHGPGISTDLAWFATQEIVDLLA